MAGIDAKSILAEIKKDAAAQLADNLPTVLSITAGLVGGGITRLPIPGPPWLAAGVKKLLRGVGAGVFGTLTRMSASPATPATSPIQAKLAKVAGR